MIEDNPGDSRIIQDMLAEAKNIQFAVDWKQTLKGGLDSLAENKYDVILLDLGLPDSPQRSVSFTRVQAAAPAQPIVIMTGLDDDTFAVTTVRRGAQDYLVKGKTDTDTLVRTIRYAIARKLGGDKQFTLAELSQYNGQDGKAAYIAHNGKVYDATGSRLWRGGKHAGKHVAGSDLTEVFANAPHGEDKLARLPIVGVLVKEESLQQKLLKQFDNLHPHATLVHLSITFAVGAPFAFLGWLFSGNATFEEVTFALLGLGLAAVLLSFLTGVISWILRYETKAAREFNLKFALGILLLITLFGTFILRLTSPQAVLSQPGSYYYLTLLIVQLALALALDFYGKRVVYS